MANDTYRLFGVLGFGIRPFRFDKMDIYEQIERLDELKRYISTELPQFARQVAGNDLAALVANRVIQRGENFKGGRFSAYSTKTVAAYRFWGKSRTQAAERRVRAVSRAKGALSYSDFRKLNNLRSDTKNFEFTGEMWRKFGIVSVNLSGDSFKILVGGTTPAAQKKIDENSAREGISIIEANDKERNVVNISVADWMNREANRILNG